MEKKINLSRRGSPLNPTKLIIYKDKVLKVLEENKSSYCGYDIISEKMYSIKKNCNAILLPEIVVRLLGCEETRLRVTNALCCGNLSEMADKLGFSERNVFRLLNKYDFFTDDKKEKNKIFNLKRRQDIKLNMDKITNQTGDENGKKKYDGRKQRLPKTESRTENSTRIQSELVNPKNIKQGAVESVKFSIERTTKTRDTSKTGESKKHTSKNWDI